MDDDNNYRYFLYSAEQMELQKKMADKMGRVYVVGSVIYQGKRRSYTERSKTDYSPKFSDSRVVAEGNQSELRYKDPFSEPRKVTTTNGPIKTTTDNE